MYAIDDGAGNQLRAGLDEYTARKVAQGLADSRGESVYLYEMRPIDSDEEESERFAPEEFSPR